VYLRPENRGYQDVGKFIKGVSGNPGGRPRVAGHVRELARKHTAGALRTLAEIMEDSTAPAQARIVAACALLDRAYGKPCPDTEYNDSPVTIVISERDARL
jgi:hypothetical protein